jgi:hypothetical protein
MKRTIEMSEMNEDRVMVEEGVGEKLSAVTRIHERGYVGPARLLTTLTSN